MTGSKRTGDGGERRVGHVPGDSELASTWLISGLDIFVV